MKFLRIIPIFIFLTIYSLHSQTAIIPTPESFVAKANLTIRFNDIHINSSNVSKDEETVMKQWIGTVFKTDFDVFETPDAFTIQFQPLTTYDKIDEYKIDCDGYVANISYSSPASKLYAISSLIQQITIENGFYSLNKFNIVDYAKFSWRGMHLDVCRHFFTVDEVKKYIDLMAFYKFNTFHWHLTDDQGWRIEIKKYPLLTQIGAYRDSTLNNHYNTEPQTWDRTRYGGFYTQEEIKDVVKYAAVRGITIVPEIEMPGHASAAIAAYPELSCVEEKKSVPGTWGVFDDVFCPKAETISFLQDVLTEVVELFPSKYIHIGGDEAPTKNWKNSEDCKKIKKENNLEDEKELQSWFIQQMDDFLSKKGRILVGWDEITDGKLSNNATVMSWRGQEGGIKAANLHHQVIMAPVSHCYFDHYQGDKSTEPLAFGGYTPLEKVFAFNPIPEDLPEANKKYILGGQANLWTEYIPDFKQVEYMVFPRALAMIENLWCTNKPSYNDFLKSLTQKQFDILNRLDVNYSHTAVKPTLKLTKSNEGITVIAKSIDQLPVHLSQKGETTTSNGSNTLQLNRTINEVTEKELIATESLFNSSSSIKVLHHKGLGLSVDFSTLPTLKSRSNSKFKLVDGLIGDNSSTSDNWIYFDTDTIEFMVYLDAAISYKKASLNFLDAQNNNVFLPESIAFYGSKNGKKWKLIEQKNITESKTSIAFNSPPEMLKCVVVSKNHNAIMAIDELILE